MIASKGRAGATGVRALAALAALAAFVIAPAAAEEGRGASLEVEAQRVELDREAGEALFTGDVLLRHESLELRCARMTARVDEEGRLTAVEAAGDVRIAVTGGIRATAGQATYHPAARRVALGGDPIVRTAQGVLRGRRMTIDLGSGRVSIEGARGTFRVR